MHHAGQQVATSESGFRLILSRITPIAARRRRVCISTGQIPIVSKNIGAWQCVLLGLSSDPTRAPFLRERGEVGTQLEQIERKP